MTPEILSSILDNILEMLKTFPETEDQIDFEFNQLNSKKFLENDETRQIIYEFLTKLEKPNIGF